MCISDMYDDILSLFLFLILMEGYPFKSVCAMLIMLLSLCLTSSEF